MRVSGLDAIALTKLDVLDDHDEIRIATGYIDRRQARLGRAGARGPLRARAAGLPVVPRLEDAPSRESRRGRRCPARAREYVTALEEIVGAKVGLLSTGAKREETIVRPGTALDGWLKATVGQPA